MGKAPVKSKKDKRLRNFQGEKVIIGVDQSYTRTGISIAINGKLKKVTSIDFKNTPSKTEKRLLLQRTLRKAIKVCLNKYDAPDIAIVCERIRTYTSTFDLRPSYMKATGALIAYIVDTGYEYGINTYSVDTRAWKSAVLGSSQPTFPPVEGVKDPQKFGSVRYVMKLGFDESLIRVNGRGGKGHFVRDDDAADSACIALSPFKATPDKFTREY